MDELARKVWDRFMMKCAIDTWGERTVIAERKQIVNLLGSAEKHFKLFKEAFAEVMEDHLEPE